MKNILLFIALSLSTAAFAGVTSSGDSAKDLYKALEKSNSSISGQGDTLSIQATHLECIMKGNAVNHRTYNCEFNSTLANDETAPARRIRLNHASSKALANTLSSDVGLEWDCGAGTCGVAAVSVNCTAKNEFAPGAEYNCDIVQDNK